MRRFCLQNVGSILGDTKKDLPQRTDPFHYVSVILTPQWLPERLIKVIISALQKYKRKIGKHYEHEQHILHPNQVRGKEQSEEIR